MFSVVFSLQHQQQLVSRLISTTTRLMPRQSSGRITRFCIPIYKLAQMYAPVPISGNSYSRGRTCYDRSTESSSTDHQRMNYYAEEGRSIETLTTQQTNENLSKSLRLAAVPSMIDNPARCMHSTREAPSLAVLDQDRPHFSSSPCSYICP